MKLNHFALLLTLGFSGAAASAETTCSFLAFKDGYYKSKGRELPIRFMHVSQSISMRFPAQPDAEALKQKIKDFLLAKARLDFDELANAPVDGIESVLIPVTFEEMGVYGKTFFRYVEDSWGSSPKSDWDQFDYYIDETSVKCP
jgi:hypothetical protein